MDQQLEFRCYPPRARSHSPARCSPVDVALVAESTYPYLRGGVSAVMHDILCANPGARFGIIHITWDRYAPSTPLYEVPENVAWIDHAFLSMKEHQKDFLDLKVRDLHMRSRERTELSTDLLEALRAICANDCGPIWQLYDRYMNPRTRVVPLWPILGSREFMRLVEVESSSHNMSLAALFWLIREFFALGCALAGHDYPNASVYHAHTSGYAAVAAAIAARQNDGRFLLTEHNLYVRDTINEMLDRSMALPVTRGDWSSADVSESHRAWMAWLIEMGTVGYHAAHELTYLYPKALEEAAVLGAPVARARVIPNGSSLGQFSEPRRKQVERDSLRASSGHHWTLAYVARVVRIKGLLDLLDALSVVVERGHSRFELRVMGHADETPEYLERCKSRSVELGLESQVMFMGSQNLKEAFGEVDLVVLPSHNEGQPLVILEAMTAGVPVVGTGVGGMEQLLCDPLERDGVVVGPCGIVIEPHAISDMADAILRMICDQGLYSSFRENGPKRIEHAFQLSDAMSSYTVLYAGMMSPEAESVAAIDEPVAAEAEPVAALDPPRSDLIEVR